MDHHGVFSPQLNFNSLLFFGHFCWLSFDVELIPFILPWTKLTKLPVDWVPSSQSAATDLLATSIALIHRNRTVFSVTSTAGNSRRAEKPGVVLKTYCTELMIVNANANAMILLVW